MKVYIAGPSPYARKVRLTALVKGLADHMSFEPADTLPVENPELQQKNPLAKIPILMLNNGQAIYDSKVICEYLDAQVASPVLFPGDGPDRWQVLTLGALADGILDAGLLLVYEKRFRPEEKWHADWQKRQQLKIDAALSALNSAPPRWTTHPTYGHLTLACALGYLDFRFEGAWRNSHANLVSWLDDYRAAVPAFDETQPG
ncbi:MAG: glutathione S-transferase N-terminal domain-containing protein [Pseudomonadota bacterium]